MGNVCRRNRNVPSGPLVGDCDRRVIRRSYIGDHLSPSSRVGVARAGTCQGRRGTVLGADPGSGRLGPLYCRDGCWGDSDHFAVAGLPSCWLRVRRLLAVYRVIGGVSVTILFGWAVNQSAVLSLGGCFPVPEATLQESPFITKEILYLNASHAAGLLGPRDMVVSRTGVDIDGDGQVDAGWDEAVWVDHYSRALSSGLLACSHDTAGSTTLHAITRSHLCGSGSHGDDT